MSDTYTKEFTDKAEAEKFVGLLDHLYPDTKHQVLTEIDIGSADLLVA
jgi:hypothetical protein